MKKIIIALAITFVALADPPPVPVLPTSITLAWNYPANLLTPTHTVVDPTTGQTVTVTNAPITFHVWRTFDLVNWTCVTSVVNTTQATVPYVNQWADFGVTASNLCTVSLMSNVANMQAMPQKSVLQMPVINK